MNHCTTLPASPWRLLVSHLSDFKAAVDIALKQAQESGDKAGMSYWTYQQNTITEIGRRLDRNSVQVSSENVAGNEIFYHPKHSCCGDCSSLQSTLTGFRIGIEECFHVLTPDNEQAFDNDVEAMEALLTEVTKLSAQTANNQFNL